MKAWMQLLVCSVLVPWAVADQPMETTDILLLLEKLCRQPADGWINHGRIEAIHHSTDRTDRSTETLETVTTDGNRFIWHIRMNAGDDAESSPNQSEFIEWNRDRTFIWDSQSYTLCFKSGTSAIVYENPSMPVNVSGPLTAGYIPWGKGVFTVENLSAALPSATTNGSHVQLMLRPSGGPPMQFVLDSDRDHAVLSYTLFKPDGSKTTQIYGNYIQQQDKWLPMNIQIDRYDRHGLLVSDAWEIVSVNEFLPPLECFTAAFQEKAFVEVHSPVLNKPVFYRHSTKRNIKPLLEDRFITALKKEQQQQNCGTVAAGKILSAFGICVTDSELETLVRAESGDISLYQLRQFIQKKGLFCLPLKTSISGLERFKGAQVILHFPHKKHFVLLDRIENNTLWIIDLDRQTFYHCMDTDQFKQEWGGIALVVSEMPLLIDTMEVPVPDPVLKNITGSADYSCSDLIQDYDVAFCPEMVMGTCGGRYGVWYQRYACKKDSSGGYCSGTGVIGSVYSSCTEDMYDPTQCFPTGNYIGRYMRACQP
jgi:hypothetical protein